jgi:pyruvate dehydrogenase E1 component
VGQLYEPVDSETLLYYKESTDGQILEEGITEAGAMASFIAAGTAYSNHSIPMIPFYIYYSMFGFQRVGDLVYAAADCRARGFMVGGTAGRTTLPGEGLQHQDGHSHLLFSAVPTCRSYDPAFAYEIAVIVREGIRRMFVDDEDMFIYMTVTNENYHHPPKPDRPDVDEGILRGMYRVIQSPIEQPRARVHLLGSGSILNEVIAAQNRLAEDYAIAADVWSVTSYTELRRDALDAERWNMLHPHEKPIVPYITKQLGPEPHATIATSDYVKTLPDALSKWIPGPLVSLGTDGFGRSESRDALRDFFEVDSRYVTLAALHALAREGEIDRELVSEAIEDLDIDPAKTNPRLA